MQSASVLCYGEIDLDVYVAVSRLPAVNLTAHAVNEFENVGGGAANVALWLANWGVPTRLIGHDLGNDRYGDFVKRRLAEFPHLDSDYIVYHDGYPTPRCQCLVTPDGERVFIMHWEQDIRITALTPEMLTGIQWLNLDLAGPIEPRLQAAQLAHAHKVPILINDIYFVDHPILPYVDILVLSASVIQTKQPDIPPHDLAQQLQGVGQCDVIITDGGRPIFALLKNGDTLELQPPTIEVVDTTGAGDIFKAGLLYGLVEGLPLADALVWAVSGGSVMSMQAGTTTTFGSLDQVREMTQQVK